MKRIIAAIKAFFKVKRIFKKEEIMKIETIQKLWIIIGSIVGGLAFIPDWVKDLFTEEGTSAVFGAVAAIIALFQFMPWRTGSGEKELRAKKSAAGYEPSKLEVETEPGSKLVYALWPFKKAE